MIKTVSPNKVDSDLIKLNEIFTSIQGEGTQIGRPVIFVRVSKCNMSCYFCDTNYQPVWYEGSADSVMQLIEKEFKEAKARGDIEEPAVLLTGGEPTIYNLEPLLKLLNSNGYWIGIESNGRNNFIEWEIYFDHITISPKAPKGLGMLWADEVRLVVQKFVTEDYLKELGGLVKADNYYLSPMCDDKGNFNWKETYKLLAQTKKMKHKNWRLSLQTHKLAGIR